LANLSFQKIKVLAIFLIAIFIMATNPQGLRDTLCAILLPIELFGAKIRSMSHNFQGALQENVRLKEENRALKKQVAELLHNRARQEEIFAENRRLRKLLDYKEKSYYRLIIADVIGFDPTSAFSTIVIGRGREDGVERGSAVVALNPDGEEVLVGRVIERADSYSVVLLITDPNSLIPVRLKIAQEKGILVGCGKDMELKFIGNETDVAENEPVVTLKQKKMLEDILIGYVKEVGPKRRGLFRKIRVKPAAGLKKLREVMVIAQ
jgi:rod shape-determining protein MreC